MNQTSPKNDFTVDEVNQRLPLMRAIVSDIVALHGNLAERRSVLNTIRGGAGPKKQERSEDNPHEEELLDIERDLDEGQAKLDGFEKELLQLGGSLVDAESGIVEFPSLMDGREICLSWKHGEDEIMYWHEIDEDFDVRKTLLEGTATGDANGDSAPSDR